jgi:hypothetical protein
MGTPIRVTELDFDTLKANFKTFLQGQSEFSDYDFEGSGLSVMLDVLTYNTHMNALLAHFLANEQFIDTATKRSSVASLAKTLGYTPRSAYSARATVNITVTPTTEETTLSLPTSTKFVTSINGTSYSFYPAQEYTAELDEGVFLFEDVVLVEGTPLATAFTAAADTLSGPFVIPAETIDLSTLLVSVQTSSTELEIENFSRETTIVDIGPDDAVFWVEEGTEERYQIVFGDDIIGKQLSAGNVIIARYHASSGATANGARLFTLSGTISGESAVSIELVTAAAAGSARESIDSIRFNAPKFNTTRNRAVTAQDYKSIILAGFDKAKAVSVWGGEHNNPPIFGTVFITIDPKNNAVVTDGDKDYILNTLLRPRSVMTVRHEFVDPDYLYLGFDIRALFNPKTTSFTGTELATGIVAEVQDYFNTTLTTLDQTFFYSEFVDRLQQTNPSLRSVLVKMLLQKRLAFATDIVNQETVSFLTPLVPSSIKSTIFRTTVNEQQFLVYLQDFPTGEVAGEAATGVLKLVDSSSKAVVATVGSIVYTTGVATIENVVVTEYVGGLSEIRLSAQPTELGRNISPAVVSTAATSQYAIAATPSKNIVVALDNSEGNTGAALRAGLTVSAVPFVESL